MTDAFAKLSAESQSQFQGKKYRELIKTYEKMIECGPAPEDLYKTYSNLSYVHWILKNHAEARDAANRVIELAGDWYKGYYRLAKAHELELNYEGAAAAFAEMKSRIDVTDKSAQKCLNDAHNMNVNILGEWILKNDGAIHRDIHIQYYMEDYRGMTVNRTVNSGQSLIEVPLACAISREEAKERGYCAELLKAGFGDMNPSPHTFMALELLDVKYDPGHFKQPLVKCLPKLFKNVPINFTEEEKRPLKGSYALVKIQQKIEQLEREYVEFVTLLMKNDVVYPYSLQDFIWARTAIITRIYAIKRYKGTALIEDNLLCPFADMANHVIPPNTTWRYDENRDKFVVVSTKFIHEGDDIYESYGEKCNYRYFVNYGFTVDNNPGEEAVLLFSDMVYNIVKNELYVLEPNQKNSCLVYLSTCGDVHQIGYQYNDACQAALGYYRNKVKNYYASKKESLDCVGLELEVLQLFVNAAKTSLSLFDSPSPDDEKNFIDLMDIDFNVRNCYVQKKEEKKVLNFLILFFAECQELLRSTDRRARARKIAKKYLNGHASSYKAYIAYLCGLKKTDVFVE